MEPPGKTSLASLLRRLFRYLLRYKGLTALVICLGAAEALFTRAPVGIAKVALDVLFPSPAPDPAARPDLITRWVTSFQDAVFPLFGIDKGSVGSSMAILFACVVIICLLAVCGAFAIRWFTYTSRYLATKVVMDLRHEVTSHLITLSLRFFSGRRMGDLISRVTNDTATTMQSFNLIFENVVLDPLLILVTIGIIMTVNPWLGLLVLVVIPTIALPLVTMGRAVRKSSGRSLSAMGESTEAVTQILSGIRTVKAFQLEDLQLKQFGDANELYLRRTRQMLRRRSGAQGLTFFGYNVGFAAFVLLGGYFSLEGTLRSGDLFVLLASLSLMYANVKRLSRAYQVFMESMGALDRLEELLLLENDVADRPGALAPPRFEGRVEFENVSFAYEDAPVVREVSFRVEPGQTVALVGPSGAGKSTMLDLIARFYDPSSGVVRVDGNDLRDLEVDAFRKHLAVVSQSPFLFNTTIEDNIRHGKPGASFSEVVAAAKTANIHEFIHSLPEGYATVVGERGSKLSGGQLQRITIARAILKDAAILLLDEATSSLDSESEELVQRALNNLMKGRTSFVIAHRLSTVRSADRILVMDAGRIVQDGRHHELVARDGLYRRLYELQRLVDLGPGGGETETVA